MGYLGMMDQHLVEQLICHYVRITASNMNTNKGGIDAASYSMQPIYVYFKKINDTV